MLGSRVLPDLLETMKSVLARSSFFSTVLICAGSVESSMCRRGKPGVCPKVSASTSGQRLDPPMPSSRMSENPALLTSSANSFSLAALASCSPVTSSHPSQLASSSPVQSEASCCHRRLTLPDARQSLRFFFTAASKSAGRDAVCGLVLGALDRLGFFLTSATHSAKGASHEFH